MYYLKTEQSFDAAHFLKDYAGKCSNLHGHRWRVVAGLAGEELSRERQTEGMLVDFGDIKTALKELCDYYDHSFIYEKGSLKQTTVNALEEEGFRLVEVDFRPTAENFARDFFLRLRKKEFTVHRVEVYETPSNCAVYEES
ncbi:MAG: 6-carboxytetrahydropterin synthase QueD [Firmicutes bacterium]|nr:6-carboxytetrahydropterin synthase QueD [Bacillota bacterium]